MKHSFLEFQNIKGYLFANKVQIMIIMDYLEQTGFASMHSYVFDKISELPEAELVSEIIPRCKAVLILWR